MKKKINYYFDDDGVYADSFPASAEAVAPPDNALWVAPPEECPNGHTVVVRKDKSGWDIVPDYRATGAFSPDGQWYRITTPGPLPEGWLAELPEPEFTPGVDFEKRDDGNWYRIRYTKKGFLLLCGLMKVAALNAAINAGNDMAKTAHDLLFASEYIDVTDPDTIQLVEILTTAKAGNILTDEDAARVLAGELYGGENEKAAE
ncbi:hypothetical protein C4J81_04645 [Deltaproteobacteria bacterium Smac51]|nr:hypothetical protein C4J81_01045 [Deltaproteobacteria bacterium Smac51]UQZ88531.1 hypothetical protein C4J81_04645 [Deltaproteobacteria bacterium Smac51]